MPVPYAGQEWKHGWIPITPGAARQKNHGRKPGPDSRVSAMMDQAIRERAASKGAGRRAQTPSAGERRTVHKITDAYGDPHSFVVGMPSATIHERAKAQRLNVVDSNTQEHNQALDNAPPQLRQVWESARRHGWPAQFGTSHRSGGEPLHRLTVTGPNGEKHDLTWYGNKRATNVNQPSVKKVLADMESPTPRHSRPRPSPDAPKPRTADAIARREEAAGRAASQRDLRLYNEAQARQTAASQEIKARRAQETNPLQERLRLEDEGKKLRSEALKAMREAGSRTEQQKVRGTELSNQAARAYKAGDYTESLNLLAQAIKADPANAGEYLGRRQMVARALDEQLAAAQRASHL